MAGNILHLRTRVAAAKAQLTDATVCLWIYGNQNITRHSFFCITRVFNIYSFVRFFLRGCCTWCTGPTWASQNPTCRCFSNGNIVGVDKVWRRRSVNFQRWTCPSFHDRRRWHRKTWWVEVEGLGWVELCWVFGVSRCAKTRFFGESFGRSDTLEIGQTDTWNSKRYLLLNMILPRNSWNVTRIL